MFNCVAHYTNYTNARARTTEIENAVAHTTKKTHTHTTTDFNDWDGITHHQLKKRKCQTNNEYTFFVGLFFSIEMCTA